MLHKDYGRKGSFAKKKISGHEPQGAWRQDELIGGKPSSREVTSPLILVNCEVTPQAICPVANSFSKTDGTKAPFVIHGPRDPIFYPFDKVTIIPDYLKNTSSGRLTCATVTIGRLKSKPSVYRRLRYPN
jgi:hypothetical protein